MHQTSTSLVSLKKLLILLEQGAAEQLTMSVTRISKQPTGHRCHQHTMLSQAGSTVFIWMVQQIAARHNCEADDESFEQTPTP